MSGIAKRLRDSANLREKFSTVTETKDLMREAADALDQTNAELRAARKTLEFLGYTYRGGEMWVPPIEKVDRVQVEKIFNEKLIKSLQDSLEVRSMQLAALAKSQLENGPRTPVSPEPYNVVIVDRAAMDRAWGHGPFEVILRVVQLPPFCPFCGALRGTPVLKTFTEQGITYQAHVWSNPCGHPDQYRDLIAQIDKTQG